MIPYGLPAEQVLFLAFEHFLWFYWQNLSESTSRMISTTTSCIPCCNQATSLCISTVFWDTSGKYIENVNSESSVGEQLCPSHSLFFLVAVGVYSPTASFSCHLRVTHDECAAWAPGPELCFCRVHFCRVHSKERFLHLLLRVALAELSKLKPVSHAVHHRPWDHRRAAVSIAHSPSHR